MKLRDLLAGVFALVLVSTPALAQVTPGTSPLSIQKGGTGANTAAGARTDLGLGTMATQNANGVAITGGAITGLPSPLNPTDAAIKSYVDAVATGLTVLPQSRLATAAVLPNTPTYSNGSSGVGATLTAGTNSTLTVDGTVANLNDVVLVKNQAAPAQNGIYTVTTAGSGSVPWVLTRATYFNVAAQMKAGSYTFITAGTVNINNAFTLATAVVTVGTDPLNYNLFSSAGTTVSNSDGSLTISPTSGSVIASLNPAHANTWSGAQQFNSDALFKDGRPWCDIRSQGAVQDSSTDDTAAWNACITVLSAFGTGGTLYVPPAAGISCIKTAGGVVHSSGGVIRFLGASEGVTVGACGTDTQVLTIGVATDSIENFFFIGKGVNNDTGTFGASHPTLILNAACTQCYVGNNFFWGGSNAISVQTSDAYFSNNNASFAYGSALVYLGSNGPVVGNWFVRDKFDQIYPQSYPGPITTINAWAATTAYTLGTIVSNQGYYLQSTHAGTSSGSQPTLKNYGITITDGGTLTWQLVAPQNYYGVQVDTNASENQFLQTDLTGPFTTGLGMTNTLAGTAPTFTTFMEGVIGQVISQGVNLHDGHDFTMIGGRVGGALITGGAAVLTNGNWANNLVIDGVTVLVSGGTYGVFLGAGTRSVVSNNRVQGSAVTDCILVSTVTDVVVSGNILDTGCAGSIATNGGADYYDIVNNIVHGVAVSDGASGVHKTVSGNN